MHENLDENDDQMNEDQDILGGIMALENDAFHAMHCFKVRVWEIQEEAYNASEKTQFSVSKLLNGVGETGGHRVSGRTRALMVLAAIGIITDIPSRVIGAVLYVYAPEGEEFQLKKKDISQIENKNVIQTLLENGAIDVKISEPLLLGLKLGIFGSSRKQFRQGVLIQNNTIIELKGNASATERLAERDPFILQQLPKIVDFAKVIRVDRRDNTLKWTCIDDPSLRGWVRMDGVQIANTTYEVDSESDDESGSWLND